MVRRGGPAATTPRTAGGLSPPRCLTAETLPARSNGRSPHRPAPHRGCPPFLRTHCHLATARRNLQHTSKASERCSLKKKASPSKRRSADPRRIPRLPDPGTAAGRAGAGGYRRCGFRAGAQHGVRVTRRQTHRDWPTPAGRRGRCWPGAPGLLERGRPWQAPGQRLSPQCLVAPSPSLATASTSGTDVSMGEFMLNTSVPGTDWLTGKENNGWKKNGLNKLFVHKYEHRWDGPISLPFSLQPS